MAVESSTYGTVAGVERMIGDIVDSRTFSNTTVPSDTQVEQELDNVADDINSVLDFQGYTVPVDSTNYPYAYGFLKAASEYGAAARLLGTIPPQAYDPDEQMEEQGQTRAQMYERYLNRAIKRIMERKLRAGMRENRFDKLKAGAATDSDGVTKDPLFRRRMGEYPGARILPSEESADEET